MAGKSTKKVNQVTQEVVQEVTQETQDIVQDSTLELMLECEYKLDISVVKGIEMIPGAKLLRIENLGVGDVYAGIKDASMKEQSLILTGSSKEFDDEVYVIATCRPLIRVSYFK